mmetsp:Transcript_68592/g.143082  ORF Transcript_68592/g.143082 Transcript_68592/m.143082 type:complete len:204 (-) Transcript_68592:320-931(-)
MGLPPFPLSPLRPRSTPGLVYFLNLAMSAGSSVLCDSGPSAPSAAALATASTGDHGRNTPPNTGMLESLPSGVLVMTGSWTGPRARIAAMKGCAPCCFPKMTDGLRMVWLSLKRSRTTTSAACFPSMYPLRGIDAGNGGKDADTKTIRCTAAAAASSATTMLASPFIRFICSYVPNAPMLATTPPAPCNTGRHDSGLKTSAAM